MHPAISVFVCGVLLWQGVDCLLKVSPGSLLVSPNSENMQVMNGEVISTNKALFSCLEVLPDSQYHRPNENVVWSLNSKIIDTTGSKYRRYGKKKQLLIKKLTYEDSGVYECALISNSTERGKGELWITPEVISAPESQTLQINTNNTITCLVTGGLREVEWKKDNRTIAHSNRTVTDTHYSVLNSGSLLISNLTPSDGGHYRCSVSNRAGKDSRSIEVKVIAPPDNCIVQHESDEEITTTEIISMHRQPVIFFNQKPPSCIHTTVGFNITLRCSAEANSHPTNITWLKERTIITGEGDHYILLPDGSLKINTIQNADEEVYTCQASTANLTRNASVHLQVTTTVNFHCGIPNRARRVVGGNASHIQNWPWQVLLQFTTTPREIIGLGSEPLCGGALIHPEWIITAAHCLHYLNNIDWFSPGQLIVQAGVFNRTDKTEQHQQTLEIDHYVVHPRYRINDISTRDNDIALLKLSHPVMQTKHIGFICLPQLHHEDPPVGTLCTVTGWGHLTYRASFSPDLLHSAQVPIVSRRDCRSDKSYSSNLITLNKLCAGWKEGGADSCQNDSGGPLACRTPGNSWVLYGIVNGGKGCGSAHKYGIYARVTRYSEWIASIVH